MRWASLRLRTSSALHPAQRERIPMNQLQEACREIEVVRRTLEGSALASPPLKSTTLSPSRECGEVASVAAEEDSKMLASIDCPGWLLVS